MFEMNSVGDFCGVDSDRKLCDDENTGMSNFRFLGGVMVGDIGDILLLPLLNTFVTRLLLVNCCFFCLMVSARVSTFLILAALFSSE